MPNMLMVITLLALTGGGAARGDADPTLIQWAEGCDTYSVTAGVYPRLPIVQGQSGSDPAQCQSLCTGRTDCGGVSIHTSGSCALYNINDDVISHLTDDTSHWYDTLSSMTWYSKTCAYDVGVPEPQCADYSHSHYNRFIDWSSGWRITYAYEIPGMRATECQRWCGLHPTCRSVEYRYWISGDRGACTLYGTTIPDLLAGVHEGNVVTYIGSSNTLVMSYDRWCAHLGLPYVPNTVPL